MPDPQLLTKAASPTSMMGSRSGLPQVLLQKVPQRLRVMSILVLAILSISWFGVNLAEGEFLHEFTAPHKWVGPVGMIVGSIIVLYLSRAPNVAPEMLVTVGLFFQVLVSWGIGIGTFWGAFEGFPAELVNGDRVGMSPVALWIVLFPAMVPAKATHTMLALVGSAMAMPVVYVLNVQQGIAPELGQGTFTQVFVLPYLICAGVGFVLSRVVFRLGQDVRRAQALGSYQLREVIGSGGMGEVWLADHGLLARSAAVKLIKREVLATRPDRIDEAVARFEREAQITAALESPHTVSLYDFGVSVDGTLYYVMELLEGTDLQTLVGDHGPLPAARVIHILRKVCASLGEAHRRGLIHRDIKPSNIMLCQRAFEHDFVKVLDFGLAKYQTQEELGQGDKIVGTPAYIAPELALGNVEPDRRADLYALGCVAFWLLAGRPVFEATSAMGMVVAHVEHAPPSLGEHVDGPLPDGLAALVESCLAKNPDDRVADAADLDEMLAEIATQAPWSQRDAVEAWESSTPSTASRP
jgi:serine/threonine-protein kinase